MNEKNNQKNIITISDMCDVLEVGEIFNLLRAHKELAPVFWNYYRDKDNYSMMCSIISVRNNVLPESYINEAVELISANKANFSNFYLADAAVCILPFMKYIPESFEVFMLDSIIKSDILSCIVQYGSEDLFIKTKIKLIIERPDSIDYFVNYLCSYKYDDYNMEDFYSDLPAEYQMGVIV